MAYIFNSFNILTHHHIKQFGYRAMRDENSIIEVLPQSVVEKIAAGEVVERPASVLKELVENSLDAGATRIDVVFEDAGFSTMRVADNGDGMSREDLRKCVLPHATSKIRSAADLFSIATMGFRGEALASIAAVSRTAIVTCSDDSSCLGCEITVEGGICSEICPASRMRGTTVTVRDLFFNVPARRKFMKTPRGEHAAIIKVLEQLAMPFPGIHFTVTADGKKVIDFPPVRGLIERIGAAAGHDFSDELVECAGEGNGMSVTVFVSSPQKLQTKPRFQNLYVNLRRIDNDSVTYAVREAFAQYLGHGNRPAFFCFLDVDSHRVDVNVHPTKQQMKFDDERGVFGFIYNTVKNGLRKYEVAHEDIFTTGDTCDVAGKSINERTIENFADSNGVTDNKDSFYGDGREDAIAADGGKRAWELIQCYQIHGIFILAPIKNGILLIDQHAAHERVLYEQAVKDMEDGHPISQQLLLPIVFEMSPAEKIVLDSGKDYFIKIGFEITDFGGTAVSVSALPVFLRDGQAEETVREMARYLTEGREPDAFKEPIKRFAAAFACGAAIKSGQKLSQEEMNALINALFSTDNPYTCPHGRPTIVRISVDELTRRFLR